MRLPRLSPLWIRTLIAVGVFLVGLIATQWWAYQVVSHQEEHAATEASERADQFRDRLESTTASAYFITHSLDLYVRNNNGKIERQETNNLLLGLYNHGEFVRSVALAPGNRIAYIEPLEGNGTALGLYYPDNPEQWPAIQAAIANRQPTFTGPITLVQGGRGLAYRVPIYINTGRYWGIASTVLDADAYIGSAAATSNLSASQSAVRSVGTNGEPGTVFWGDPNIFAANASLADVKPLGANWQVAVLPAPVDAAIVRPTQVFGTLISLVLAGMIWLLLGSRERHMELSRTLTSLSRQAPGLAFQFTAAQGQPPSFRFVSEGSRELFGLEPEDVIRDGALFWSRLPVESQREARKEMFESAEKRQPWHARLLIRDASGKDRWYAVNATAEPAPGGGFVWAGFLADTTAEVATENRLRMSASLFDSTHDGVVITDAHERVIDVNPAFTNLTGYTISDMAGHRVLDVIRAGSDAEIVHDDMIRNLTRHGFWRGEVTYRTKGGRVASRPVAISAVKNDDGETIEYVGVFGSMDPAQEDAVTGLPGRQVLADAVARAVDGATSPNDQVALMVVGVDHFRDINEAFGHRVGDGVLRTIGHRIRDAVPNQELVARLSGDEFGVLLQQRTDVSALEQLARAIIESIAQPFDIGEKENFLTVSLGTSIFPDDTDNAGDLITNAHQALRVAKEEGRDRHVYFTPQMQERARIRTELTDGLRVALDEGQLHMVFQPIVSVETGELHKAEALLRWEHPVHGFISPTTFIPVAEEAGLIKELGDFVFTEVVHAVRRTRELVPTFRVSFNMSPVEIADAHGLHVARLAVLEREGVPGTALVLEITEGLLLDRSETTMTNLRRYRDAGVLFAIDDFGTGYSSLSYLQKLDVDYLKIDRSFITGLPEDVDSLALCKAIIEMAHSLDLEVIAEGIETERQLDVVRTLGCDYMQGYLCSRPVPLDAFIDLVREYLERESSH